MAATQAGEVGGRVLLHIHDPEALSGGFGSDTEAGTEAFFQVLLVYRVMERVGELDLASFDHFGELVV